VGLAIGVVAMIGAAAVADPASYRGSACRARVAAMRADIMRIAQDQNETPIYRGAFVTSYDGVGGNQPGAVIVTVSLYDTIAMRARVDVRVDNRELSVDPNPWVAQTVAAVKRKQPTVIELWMDDDVAVQWPLVTGLSALGELRVIAMNVRPSLAPGLIAALPSEAQQLVAGVEPGSHELKERFTAAAGSRAAVDAVWDPHGGAGSMSPLDWLGIGTAKAIARCDCDVADADGLEALVLTDLALLPRYQAVWLIVHVDDHGTSLGAPRDLAALMNALTALSPDARRAGVRLDAP
jgi:hypothetical protein